MEHLPLITHVDIEHEIRRLFHAGPGSGLRIRVWGDDGPGDILAADSAETAREMLRSLRMHDRDYQEPEKILTAPPETAVIERALLLLGDESRKRRLLDRVLTLLGHRLVDPLAVALETPVREQHQRVLALRDQVMGQVKGLGLTSGSERRLLCRLEDLLHDDYLLQVAEHEEQVQRPRAALLAQQVLQAIGTTFREVMARWPEHAARVALQVTERLPEQVSLKELPRELHAAMSEELEVLLWAEAGAPLEEALERLFADEANQGVVPDPAPALDNDTYHEVAELCWEIISQSC